MAPPTSRGAAITDDSAAPRAGDEASSEARTRAAVAASAHAQAGAAPPQHVTEVPQKQPPLGDGGEQPVGSSAGCAGAASLGALAQAAPAPYIPAAPRKTPAQPPSNPPEVRFRVLQLAACGAVSGHARMVPCLLRQRGRASLHRRMLPHQDGLSLAPGPVVPLEDMVPPLLRFLTFNKEAQRYYPVSVEQQKELLMHFGDACRGLLVLMSTTFKLPGACFRRRSLTAVAACATLPAASRGAATDIAFARHAAADEVLIINMPNAETKEPLAQYRLSRELVVRLRLQGGWTVAEAENSEIGIPGRTSKACELDNTDLSSDDSSKGTNGDNVDDDDDEAEEEEEEEEEEEYEFDDDDYEEEEEEETNTKSATYKKLVQELERSKRLKEREQRIAAEKAAKMVRPPRCSAAALQPPSIAAFLL